MSSLSSASASRATARLNASQLRAATYGLGSGGDVRRVDPLLILAGAGTGKTLTLAHRAAELARYGLDPRRLLQLTFTRRAAREMGRRASRILALSGVAGSGGPSSTASAGQRLGSVVRTGSVPADAYLPWSGTFHSVGARLLRHFGGAIGLVPTFTVLDRGDAEDLMDLERQRLGLANQRRRVPRKGTCLSIYSRCVNARLSLDACLDEAYPWCADHEPALRRLFRAYVEAKQRRCVLDYDDLLLYWAHLMEQPAAVARIADLFDHVLVDEYQDTNALQAEILMALRPRRDGITVVGDDAQAIYSFRGSSVRNILTFAERFDPAAAVVKLEDNYRSVQPILDAANAVSRQVTEGIVKELRSHSRLHSHSEDPATATASALPRLVEVEDDAAQAAYVADRVLAARESGVDLRRQAVLFRTAHHSDVLELELTRLNIPFVKYGGLRFLEAAHVKDLLCLLRWLENPLDGLASFRALQLLPEVGPRGARRVQQQIEQMGGLGAIGSGSTGGAASSAPGGPVVEHPLARWPEFAALLTDLAVAQDAAWPDDVRRLRGWYEEQLERLFPAEQAVLRAGDLEQIERVAAGYSTRARFLAELTLDPPGATGDWAADTHLDEDYLILSTIHSAKGQEWHSVHVLNVVDGCIPSDMAVANASQVEEERRLLYVAMTRARNELHLIQPLRFYVTEQRPLGDRHLYAPRSRFLGDPVTQCFDLVSRRAPAPARSPVVGAAPSVAEVAAPSQVVDVASKIREMW